MSVRLNSYDFQWNPTTLVFTPTNAGAEYTAPATSGAIAGGVWSVEKNGTSLSFYISPDGSKVTTAGSTLSNNSSIVFTETMCGNLVTFEIKKDMTITDKKFTGSSTGITLDGIFNASNTTADVELYYTHNGCIGFSGTLQATHQ